MNPIIFLPVYSDADGVFYSPSQLGWHGSSENDYFPKKKKGHWCQ